MKTTKINPNLIKTLKNLVGSQQLDQMLKRCQKMIETQQGLLENVTNENQPNDKTQGNPKRLVSKSKERGILRRKQSKKTFEQQKSNTDYNQSGFRSTGFQQKFPKNQENDPKKLIKQKAIYVNVNEIPYLHSTDLLNHLYKKSSTLPKQDENETPLYNPPSTNPYALTKVKFLHLYYCKIQSLRDMGTGWSNLIQLSIYFGRLKDLGGLNGFPSIEYLNCPFNCIETISDLMFHPTLVSIDLQSNKIKDFSEVEHLFTVDNLEYVNLLNNPVYSNKQNRRKINEKFEKIIESQNTRLQEYIYEKNRQNWQLQQFQGIQYCNNILKEFFLLSKHDQISVESKFQALMRRESHTDQDFQAFEAKFNNEPQAQQKQSILKVQYIPPQAPDYEYFEKMIIKGKLQDELEIKCQQKIFCTPLTEVLNPKNTYIGPVLNKYFMNKLYQRQQLLTNQKVKRTNHVQKQVNDIKQEQRSSKIKKISKISLKQFSSITISSCVSGVSETPYNLQKSKDFQTTASSFSTNCTNMTNTATSFNFRRSKLTLSKSKQKSTNKTSLIGKTGQHLTCLQGANTESNGLHSSSLVKQSRLQIGRSLKHQSKQKLESKIQKPSEKTLQPNVQPQRDFSIQKGSFSTMLKRKTILSTNKKDKSTILMRND